MTWSAEVRVCFEDGRLYWQLGELAEKRKTTIGNLLQDIAREHLLGPVRATPVPAQPAPAPADNEQKMTVAKIRHLRRFYDMGLTDREIGPRIGVSPQLVGRYRDAIGLPTLRLGRRSREDEARVALIPGIEDAA
jgi:hypothetical protein